MSADILKSTFIMMFWAHITDTEQVKMFRVGVFVFIAASHILFACKPVSIESIS